MMRPIRLLVWTLGLVALAGQLTIAVASPSAAQASCTGSSGHAHAVRIASGLAGDGGTAIGPDGALYVTETAAGRISRVDRDTGAISTFATGLPPSLIGLGGVTDVVFVGDTAYALVTLVGPDVGGSSAVGIYRIDDADSSTLVADLGAFSIANPPAAFNVPSGVQFAIEAYRGGFIVTDGNHNRVLRVAADGSISELIAFPNIVPTGLEIRGRTVLMAQAGPIPHLPEDGKVVAFDINAPIPREVAVGARLLVDVEVGRHGTIYGLAQGVWPLGNAPGSPALADTGDLLVAQPDGTFANVVSGLDRPTAMEVVGTTAWVLTLDGEVWRVAHLPVGCGTHHHR